MDLSRGIVGWEDDKDPQNPRYGSNLPLNYHANLSRNYPPSRKWSLLGIVSIVTLIRYESLYTGPVNDIDCISPFASTLFAPAAGYAAQEFGTTSSILSTLAVTAYLFGYAVSLRCSFLSSVIDKSRWDLYSYHHLANCTVAGSS